MRWSVVAAAALLGAFAIAVDALPFKDCLYPYRTKEHFDDISADCPHNHPHRQPVHPVVSMAIAEPFSTPRINHEYFRHALRKLAVIQRRLEITAKTLPADEQLMASSFLQSISNLSMRIDKVMNGRTKMSPEETRAFRDGVQDTLDAYAYLADDVALSGPTVAMMARD